ncbi:MAG: dTMP kinase [Actinomycetota bacterium]|nr:dTMP kinase [Actinomycetota bacterium]
MNPAPPVTIARTAPYRTDGVFVTFEGVDGSGKTTQARLLAEHLRNEGRPVVATREPGGTPLGERIRELLLGSDAVSPWAEAALFTAARAELVERVIRPALAANADVVCDRYLDSSLAYQGIARGLGVDAVLELNREAVGGILPDRTFLLLLGVEEAATRMGRALDRIERAGAELQGRIDHAYRELAERFPDRIVALDGTLPIHELARLVTEELAARRGAAPQRRP